MSTFPKIICRVRALYPYYSEDPASLSFDKGAVIDVLTQLDSGWWDGWCDGKRGWFPSIYVEILSVNPDMADTLKDVPQRSGSQSATNDERNDDPKVPTPASISPIDTSRLDPDYSSSLTAQPPLTDTQARHCSLSPPAAGRRSSSQWDVREPNRPDLEMNLGSDSNLPEGWTIQMAKDGTTYYYYNQLTGGYRLKHPALSDSETEYDSDGSGVMIRHLPKRASDDEDEDDQFEDARTDDYHEHPSAEKRLDVDALPAAVQSDTSPTVNPVMSQWVKRVTPQGKSYYCNLVTQETTWSYDDIDQNTGTLKTSKQDDSDTENGDARVYPYSFSPALRLNNTSAKKIQSSLPIDAQVILTWQKLSSDIACGIHQLNTAAQYGDCEDFSAIAAAIVESIRLMLYSSRSMDKEASHMQDRALREPHRAVMASLSKLVLSVKMASEGASGSLSDLLHKVQRDAGDVLAAVRGFVTMCQERDIQVEQVCPKLLDDAQPMAPLAMEPMLRDVSDTTAARKDSAGEDTISKRRHSEQLMNSTMQKAKYPLNQDLLVSLQTHANQIYGSTEALLKATQFIYKLEQEDDMPPTEEDQETNTTRNKQKARSNVILLFRNLSMQVGQYLGILEDIDLTNLDSTQIPSLSEYRVHKQNLYNAIGTLFGTVQVLTDMNADTGKTVAAIEDAIWAAEDTIESIFSSVDQMVGQRKIWMMRRGTHDTDDSRLSDNTPGSPSYNPYQDNPFGDGESDADTMPHAQSTSTSATIKSVPSLDKARKRQYSTRPTDGTDTWYIGHDYADGEILFGMDGNVKAGTLPALIERLTMHDTLDMSFIANFLLTYRSFCTTEEFVTLLERRYNMRAPEGLTPEELEIWTERKQKLVRLRVFNVMKTWLENYYNDEDEFILSRLEFFTNTVIRDASPFSADQLNRLIRKRKELDADGGLKKLVPNPIDGPIPIMPKNMTRIRLLETDPIELARQLSIMDFKLYSSIRPIECLSKAWSREDAKGNVATNVKQSIDYCNRLTAWVTGSILVHEEAKKRVVIIKYWAQVAHRCRLLNNYNTCMAIISAFDNSAVGRLKKTWELVGSRTNQTLSHIRKLMGANRNFTEYREMIHSVNPPCIPFLGIYLQDLTFIEDGNPDYLKKSSNLINFAKQRKSAEVIREIKQFQSPPYTFQVIPELQDFIKSHLENSHDVETLYERSLQLEPREIAAA
ncbi:ras guanine nucleotide exchange factor domain-containing protein [Radiomyces spectabilis]|uniref:ras guanine nucleotide exchange factor domain-containing protein n=1 Tax=Radiomyces spectabilis TaxID=64574 RepID=UPI00221EA27C|nr:ras guanine nucleotide exchange factor domain-containing protein [Radiomyces spectabilis]KAI8391076.1 ras guanine nucleotide exchange factor domain-containing protein [Radiomyces spectabilis]